MQSNRTNTSVLVSIVTYGGPEYLAACLEHLPAALEGLDNVEVVVVDNGTPNDYDSEVARRYPWVRLLRLPENTGFPRGMNAGLRGSTAEVFISLNPDTVPSPRCLTRLVQVLDAEPDVAIVGPRTIHPSGELQHTIQRFPSPSVALATGLLPPFMRSGRLAKRFCLNGYLKHNEPMDADWLVGAVHAIRSRAITRANVFSERGFMFAEDMELCYFVRQQGWRVRFDPESEIVHVGNATGAREFGAFRESRWLDATYDWYVAEHSEAAARRWALANTVGLTAKAAAFSLMRDQRREYVQGLLKFHARRIVNPSGDLHSRLPPSASAT